MSRQILSTGCIRYKIVCKRVYYKELEPRVQVTLCESLPLTDQTQRGSVINNNNKARCVSR